MPEEIDKPSLSELDRFNAKFEQWKTRLLDLGARNRLLYFRPHKVSNIRLTDPHQGGLFERLVVDERGFTFPRLLERVQLSLVDDVEAKNGEEIEEYRVDPGDVETDKDPPDLERALYRLSLLARNTIEDLGINTLYLALGFLEWRETDESFWARAPLILIPVSLERESRDKPYLLKPFDDETVLNPTLAFNLRNDFGLELPELPEEIEGLQLDTFFDGVNQATKGLGWRVIREAWLGQFQFTKLVMYRDLEAHREKASAQRLVSALANARELEPSTADVPAPEGFDDIPASEFFTVLDADSSQMEALLRARAGRDLVIEGPPGTGKSQTISNLIAQLLADGKKVLFVSEKMAALEVVHRRLQERGLGPFCLEVHSHRASKSHVIRQIKELVESGLSLPEASQATEDFDRLQRQRDELNRYVRELHEPRGIRGRTAYQAHGELARLGQLPHIPCEVNVGSIVKLSIAEEEQLLRHARRLALMPDVLAGYDTHPWHGCALETWSLDRQLQIEAHFQGLRDGIGTIQASVERLTELFGLGGAKSLQEVEWLSRVSSLVTTSPRPPTDWFNRPSLQPLMEATLDHRQRFHEHHTLRDETVRFYRPSLFHLDCGELAGQVGPRNEATLSYLLGEESVRSLGLTYRRELDQGLTQAAGFLNQLKSQLTSLLERSGDPQPTSLASVAHLGRVGEIVLSDPRPQPSWFDWTRLHDLEAVAAEAADRMKRLQALKTQILGRFREDILQLPLAEMCVEFETTFKPIWRILRGSYRRELEKLRGLLNDRDKLGWSSAVEWLRRGSELQNLEGWFRDHRGRLAESLGLHFRGEETDWGGVLDAIHQVRQLLELYHGQAPPQKLMDGLVEGGMNFQDLVAAFEAVSSSYGDLDRVLEQLSQRILIVGGDDTSALDLEALSGLIDQRLSDLRSFWGAIDEVNKHLLQSVTRTPDEIAADLSRAAKVQELEAEFERLQDDLVRDYGAFFAGLETDWESIFSALEWTGEVVNLFGDRPIPARFIDIVRNEQAIEAAKIEAERFQQALARLPGEWTYLYSVFPADRLTIEGNPFDSASLDSICNWLEERLETIGELSDWVQFEEARRACSEAKLGEFVSQVLERKIPGELVEDALRKRLLTLWLDELYAEVPALREFRWQEHEQIMADFRRQDRLLMDAHAKSIQGRLNQKVPNLKAVPNAGQARFILRELQKRKRHAPLRRLFASAPHIILGLKPCLLMSPLSVSSYLTKGMFQFDVVIFDEASQMPPEESICSILRGNQLIVAGDDKQLPPTRFFQRMIEGGDQDEESNGEPLESILDECKALPGMDSTPLLWHYRSRHESLIAFSNAHFYENRLVTFPSVDVESAQTGVRFEHVSDGIYDAGRSNTNRAEARRVAEHILEHFETWGSRRSLGVITLSEAQRDCVLEELERLLSERPDLEQFTRDQGEKPFFVKALENVQGDERGSLILTVGYGPGANGQVHLQFGPINVTGGERRLNVAVTRAKWQLTLVSSMLPHDIDPSRTRNVGPRLLRSYIEYARDGQLPPVAGPPSGTAESPFEQSVCDELRGRGFDIDLQVGCSGYRIDLAVRDPDQPQRYLLGIECDGATYHRFKTARDRDRLRQEVLERRGWRIHRVWSTDWIRARHECIQRLEQAIEGAKAAGPDGESSDPVVTSDESSDGPLDEEPSPELGLEVTGGSPGLESTEEDPYASWIDDIGEFRTMPVTRSKPPSKFYDGWMSDIAKDLVQIIEYEGPIHYDEAARRLARGYGLKRAGSRIQARVDEAVRYAKRKGLVRTRSSFLWPKGLDEVKPRRPGPDEKLRSITEVPPEELGSAAHLIAVRSHGIDRKTLIAEIGRLLGYHRTGDLLVTTIGEAVQKMLESGVLRGVGDQIVSGVPLEAEAMELADDEAGTESHQAKQKGFVLGWPPGAWKKLAKWGRETKKLNPHDRHFSFDVGRWTGHAWELSENQMKWAKDLQRKALDRGFRPDKTS